MFFNRFKNFFIRNFLPPKVRHLLGVPEENFQVKNAPNTIVEKRLLFPASPLPCLKWTFGKKSKLFVNMRHLFALLLTPFNSKLTKDKFMHRLDIVELSLQLQLINRTNYYLYEHIDDLRTVISLGNPFIHSFSTLNSPNVV